MAVHTVGSSHFSSDHLSCFNFRLMNNHSFSPTPKASHAGDSTTRTEQQDTGVGSGVWLGRFLFRCRRKETELSSSIPLFRRQLLSELGYSRRLLGRVASSYRQSLTYWRIAAGTGAMWCLMLLGKLIACYGLRALVRGCVRVCSAFSYER